MPRQLTTEERGVGGGGVEEGTVTTSKCLLSKERSVHLIVCDTSDVKRLQKIQGYFTISFEKIIKTRLNSDHCKYTII